MHKTFRLITMLRGALVAKIYDHTLVIEMNETKSTAAITLMSTDVEGIARGLQNFSDIWAMVIEFGVGTYLLSRSVGPATIFVVVPSLCENCFYLPFILLSDSISIDCGLTLHWQQISHRTKGLEPESPGADIKNFGDSTTVEEHQDLGSWSRGLQLYSTTTSGRNTVLKKCKGTRRHDVHHV